MNKKDFSDWCNEAAVVQIEGRAFIDGAPRHADSEKTFPCVSPIDGRVLVQVAECGEADVDAAVAAARRAFEMRTWAGMNPRDRKAVLLRWAALIREHLEELALLETLDTGKPIGDTTAIDVPAAAECIAWYAEALDKVGGEVVPADHHLVGLVTREPVGVVAAVVPWNFPLLMAAWKFAPALAVGNSVVLKPSEKSPLTAIRIARLAHEAGMPPGVFNVVPGGAEPGRLLASHHGVDCIAFTGSTRTGKAIMECAAKSNLKRVWLELGGKSPNIVLPDCPDLERAAKAAADAIFFNMGEVCTAGSRLLVHRDIKDAFIAKVVAASRAYEPGHPLDPSVTMGPIVDRIQFERVLAYIDAGRREGRLVTGGGRVREETGGFYLQPTVFEVKPDATIAREEIFGPVLSVIEFEHLDEAVRIANDSEYGLAAAVWSGDLTTAHEVARRLRAGTVWINGYGDGGGEMSFPFGGYRQSGNGRDKSLHAFDKYTELKSTIVRLR